MGAHSRVGRRRRTPQRAAGDAAVATSADALGGAHRAVGGGARWRFACGSSRRISTAIRRLRERLGPETRSPGANEASAETAAAAAARPLGSAAAARRRRTRRRTGRRTSPGFLAARGARCDTSARAEAAGRAMRFRRGTVWCFASTPLGSFPRTSPSRGSWVASSPPRVRRWRPSLSTTLGSTRWRIRRGTTRGNDSPPGDGTTPPPWRFSRSRPSRRARRNSAPWDTSCFPSSSIRRRASRPRAPRRAAITSRRGMAGARVRRHGERGERVQPRRGSVPSEDSLRVDARARARRDASRDPREQSRSQLRGRRVRQRRGVSHERRAAAVRAQVGATRSSRSRGDARPRQANVRAQRSVGDDRTGPRAVDGETSPATPIRQRETAQLPTVRSVRPRSRVSRRRRRRGATVQDGVSRRGAVALPARDVLFEQGVGRRGVHAAAGRGEQSGGAQVARRIPRQTTRDPRAESRGGDRRARAGGSHGATRRMGAVAGVRGGGRSISRPARSSCLCSRVPCSSR